MPYPPDTVLVLIKLTKFAVALRFFCCSCKLIFGIISSFFAKFKKLYIVWSLVRRRVTRRLSRLLTMRNALNYRKYPKTVRCGCGAVAFIFSISLKPVLYSIRKPNFYLFLNQTSSIAMPSICIFKMIPTKCNNIGLIEKTIIHSEDSLMTTLYTTCIYSIGYIYA